ncbi:MAG: TfoX/Sxy family protein [Flavobacteriales bacterium]|nr:TfoX/Sxy family protein [Flavobacteriales bacterium]
MAERLRHGARSLFEQRIAEALKAQGAKPEHKKMFGGVAFMVHGNMSVGITNKGDFMVRFDGSRHAEISKWPGAKPMTFGKGDMKGFLFVDADAVESPKALEKWVTLSLALIRTLPKKTAAKSATKKPAAKAAKGAPSKKK